MTSPPGPPGAASDAAAGPASPGQLPVYPGPPAGSGRESARPPGPTLGMAVWHRLHPFSPFVRSGRHLTSFATLLVILIFLNARQAGHDFVSDLAVVLVVLVAGVISWAVTRWRVDGGVLLIETGLIRRQSLRFPLSQVQAIDVVQTGLARLLGLAEIRLRMAGADSSGGRLVALRLSDAQALRQQLLSISRGASPTAASSGATLASAAAPSRSAAPGAGAPTARTTPAAAQPERVVFRVRAVRLAVALALSITGVIVAVVVAAVALVASLTHSSAYAAVYLPVAVGVLIGVWRQFKGNTVRRSRLLRTGCGCDPGSCRGLPRRSGRDGCRPCAWSSRWCGGRSAGAVSRWTWLGRASGGRTGPSPGGCARSSRSGPARRRRKCSASWSAGLRSRPGNHPGAPAGRRPCSITSWPGAVTTATWWPTAAGSAARRPGSRWRRCRASAGSRVPCSAGSGWPRSGWTWRAAGRPAASRTATLAEADDLLRRLPALTRAARTRAARASAR